MFQRLALLDFMDLCNYDATAVENGKLALEELRKAAKTIAGITDFEREIGLKMPGIKKDPSDGGALQINSTPTFYINGVKLPTSQWLNPEYFDYAIQLEFKKAGAAPAAAQKAGGE